MTPSVCDCFSVHVFSMLSTLNINKTNDHAWLYLAEDKIVIIENYLYTSVSLIALSISAWKENIVLEYVGKIYCLLEFSLHGVCSENWLMYKTLLLWTSNSSVPMSIFFQSHFVAFTSVRDISGTRHGDWDGHVCFLVWLWSTHERWRQEKWPGQRQSGKF